MFDGPVEDFIFVVCALVGGGLLLITVLFERIFDFIGGGVIPIFMTSSTSS